MPFSDKFFIGSFAQESRYEREKVRIRDSFELKKQFLNEHSTLYREYIKILITISGVFLSVSFKYFTESEGLNWTAKPPIVGQFLSLVCGITAFHQAMKAPFNQAMDIEEKQRRSNKIELFRRPPTNLGRVTYFLQSFLFGVSMLWFLIVLICGV